MVSTRLLDRCTADKSCDDELTSGDWTDLGWTIVRAPRPEVADGIRDLTAQFWGVPAQHPAPTPVIGCGQSETAGACEYPTVARMRTRIRPGR